MEQKRGRLPRAEQAIFNLPHHVLPAGEDARVRFAHQVAGDERIGNLAPFGGELFQPGLLRLQQLAPAVGDLQQARRELAARGDERLLQRVHLGEGALQGVGFAVGAGKGQELAGLTRYALKLRQSLVEILRQGERGLDGPSQTFGCERDGSGVIRLQVAESQLGQCLQSHAPLERTLGGDEGDLFEAFLVVLSSDQCEELACSR